ncbi:MAG: hypothetical protein D3907_08090 [Candidatus Electrothrix sp. AUS3]|nr:hypothetical protein [Candidatus Electrothrix gigas]
MNAVQNDLPLHLCSLCHDETSIKIPVTNQAVNLKPFLSTELHTSSTQLNTHTMQDSQKKSGNFPCIFSRTE